MGTYPSKDIVAAAEAATSMQGEGAPPPGRRAPIRAVRSSRMSSR